MSGCEWVCVIMGCVLVAGAVGGGRARGCVGWGCCAVVEEGVGVARGGYYVDDKCARACDRLRVRERNYEMLSHEKEST